MPPFGFNPIQSDSPTNNPVVSHLAKPDARTRKTLHTASIHGKENAHRGFNPNGQGIVSGKPKAKDLILGKPRISPLATRTRNIQRELRLSTKTAPTRIFIPSDETGDEFDDDNANANISRVVDAAHAEESDDEPDWYDGSALLQVLGVQQESAPSGEDKEKKLAAVDELKDAFDGLYAKLHADLTLPLVQVLNRVSQVHAVAEGSVDIDMKRGMATYCEASDTMHGFRSKACQHLKENLDTNQKSVKTLFQKLQAAYKKRDALWDEFNASFEQCAENALAVFDELEVAIKQTETVLDKKCRVLNHETNATDRKGVLKTLLKL